jgi:hypothetical protein
MDQRAQPTGASGRRGQGLATGVLGGALYGALVAILFGGMVGATLAIPKHLKNRNEKPSCPVMGFITGMVLGPAFGLKDRSTRALPADVGH